MTRPAHEICVEQGVDRARLQAALDSKDNWGKMTHAFEFLTAVSAVLASWPEPQGSCATHGHNYDRHPNAWYDGLACTICDAIKPD